MSAMGLFVIYFLRVDDEVNSNGLGAFDGLIGDVMYNYLL
jgi:hypothetical protein